MTSGVIIYERTTKGHLSMDSDGSGKEKRPNRDDDCAESEEYEEYEELRCVVVGKTGNGKSSSINTIVGEKLCRATPSSQSTTKKCEVVEKDRFGKRLVIVDTPGLKDTETSEDETHKEIAKIVGLTSPGPHAFIIVIRIGRFTEAEIQSIDSLFNIFGPELFARSVLLFTGVDGLEADGYDFDWFLEDIKKMSELYRFLEKCGQRAVGINNRKSEDTKQVDELMKIIDTLSKQGYYTNEMSGAANRIMEEEVSRRLEKDTHKRRSEVRQEIRQDVIEETNIGKILLTSLVEQVVNPLLVSLTAVIVQEAQAQIIAGCSLQ